MHPQIKERGQALVIIAIAIVLLVAVLGLVVDGGNVFLDRRKAQGAADSAALAAALIRIKGQGDWVASALTSAKDNGYENDGVHSVVQVYSPPSDGPFVGNVEYIEVIITSHVNTYFAKVFGMSQVTNIAKATARSKASEVRAVLNGLAVVSLAPSSNCLNEKAFWVHGNTTLDITGGGVFVNSSNKDCAFIQQGGGSVRIHGAGQQITVVGGVSVQKPQLLSPGVSVGASAMNYPPPFFMPNASCGDEVAEVNADGTSMSPGTWSKKFPPEGITSLEPGVYCLKDGIDLAEDQTLAGQNVALIVLGGDVRFGSHANVNLDAPDKGDYKGLLIYVPTEVSAKVVLDGGPNATFQGTILAPASQIIIKGNDSTNGFHSQIIGYTVEADGSSNVVIVYEDAQNYDAVTMPEVQLSQ